MAESRALSVRQPWADLILMGGKDVENRTRPFPSTVPLPARIGVHASKRLDGDMDRVLRTYLRAHGTVDAVTILLTPSWRRGALLGFVTVTGCHYADGRSCFQDGNDGGLCSPWAEGGMWHWELARPVAFLLPKAMPGALGIWRLPDLEEADR